MRCYYTKVFMWNGKKFVENTAHSGSLCACALGKSLAFRSDFIMLVVSVGTGIIYSNFTVCQPCKLFYLIFKITL